MICQNLSKSRHKSTAFFTYKRTLDPQINPNITQFKTSGFTLVEFILKDELLISENFYLNKKETSLSLVSPLQKNLPLYLPAIIKFFMRF